MNNITYVQHTNENNENLYKKKKLVIDRIELILF